MRFKIAASIIIALAILAALLSSQCGRNQKREVAVPGKSSVESLPIPEIAYAPRQYVCYFADQAIIIDGHLDEPGWEAVSFTELFVDIEGARRPQPYLQTRAKLLWDSVYLYIGADLEEPQVWASLLQRDAVIYHDNDFEVFIDPDMDTYEYYELELNALNTVWDLLLVRPYRDGGPAVNAWDIRGLKTAVAVQGTLNLPGDLDSGWCVEIALPWIVLTECAHRTVPPLEGDQWKLNFSRVEWQTTVRDGRYVKSVDPSTGRPVPENNWVWSPQGLIAMHYPEMWGLVQFTKTGAGSGTVGFTPDPLDSARWALRQIYYAQHNYYFQNGKFANDQADLNLPALSLRGLPWPIKLEATVNLFEAELTGFDQKAILRITQDGRLTQLGNLPDPITP